VAQEGAERTRPAVADELVVSHLDLVGRVVGRVTASYPRHVDRRELWNAGALGLVEAARRFRPDTGIPFARYAAIRIRGAIIDAVRSRDWASRSLRRRHREMAEEAAAFGEATGRGPTDAELAGRLGVTVAALEEIRAGSQRGTVLSLDHEGEGPALRDSIPDEATDTRPDLAVEERELLGTLQEAVANLPGVHGEVIRRSYFAGELLQDIAAELGVTEARVSQIRTEALNAIRAWFAAIYDDVPAVPDHLPGKRARHAYVARMARRSTWRRRFDAAAAAGLRHAVG